MADSIKTVRVVSEDTEAGFIRINESDFDPKVHEKFEDDSEEGAEGYAKMTKAQLVSLAEERSLDPDGTKADIIARLEAADAAE